MTLLARATRELGDHGLIYCAVNGTVQAVPLEHYVAMGDPDANGARWFMVLPLAEAWAIEQRRKARRS